MSRFVPLCRNTQRFAPNKLSAVGLQELGTIVESDWETSSSPQSEEVDSPSRARAPDFDASVCIHNDSGALAVDQTKRPFLRSDSGAKICWRAASPQAAANGQVCFITVSVGG